MKLINPIEAQRAHNIIQKLSQLDAMDSYDIYVMGYAKVTQSDIDAISEGIELLQQHVLTQGIARLLPMAKTTKFVFAVQDKAQLSHIFNTLNKKLVIEILYLDKESSTEFKEQVLTANFASETDVVSASKNFVVYGVDTEDTSNDGDMTELLCFGEQALVHMQHFIDD